MTFFSPLAQAAAALALILSGIAIAMACWILYTAEKNETPVWGNLQYAQDPHTQFCFAELKYAGSFTITQVPCTPEVIKRCRP